MVLRPILAALFNLFALFLFYDQTFDSLSQHSLIFMPDISGFTSFVQNTEIEHSQHIISELLELLIDQNELDLKLAEIEGDALFYFKHKDVPGPEALLSQAKRMYQAFHKHLSYYESHRICQCGACRTAEALELKFIVHGGNFDFIKIKDTVKPHGPDVIKAHRLMKNNVQVDEYVLISEDLEKIWVDSDYSLPDDQKWEKQVVQLDMGNVGYQFTRIGQWRDNLHEVPPTTKGDADLKIFGTSLDINAKPKHLFELLSNLKYRTQWNIGVDDIQYDEGKVNRAGTKHVCVIGNDLIEFETLKADHQTDTLVYGERAEKVSGFKYIDSYFVLTPNDQTTHLEVKLLGKPSNFLSGLLKPLISLKVKKQFKTQLELLKKLAEEEGVVT